MQSGFEPLPQRKSRKKHSRDVPLMSEVSVESAEKELEHLKKIGISVDLLRKIQGGRKHDYNVITCDDVIEQLDLSNVLYDSATGTFFTPIDASQKDADGSVPYFVEGKLAPEHKSSWKWEYLEHTADIQIHSWGESLEEALALSALGMFGYMTDLETVTSRPKGPHSGRVVLEVVGVDELSVYFSLLDACLYAFASEEIVGNRILILQSSKERLRFSTATSSQEPEQSLFVLKVLLIGEKFDLSIHPQGTEVKAITYSHMQIRKPEGTLFAGVNPRDQSSSQSQSTTAVNEGETEPALQDVSYKGKYDCYVIVDI